MSYFYGPPYSFVLQVGVAVKLITVANVKHAKVVCGHHV